jgi:hypothetical protein
MTLDRIRTRCAPVLVLALAAVLAAPAVRADMVKSVESGPIWSSVDADRVCPVVARVTGGTWTRQWWTTVTGKMSVCQIRYATEPNQVAAGPIHSIADANAKCPVAAYAVNGKWTGSWTTTIPGQMSTCDIEAIR